MMTSEELVREVLSVRYYDLRKIVAVKMRRDVDDEMVDGVMEKAVSKCLKSAKKFDPARGEVWKWVVMVTWGVIQFSSRTMRWKKGVKRKIGKEDAMEHVAWTGSVEEGGINVENMVERPHWPVGAEEDALITAIDIKAGKYDPNDNT